MKRVTDSSFGSAGGEESDFKKLAAGRAPCQKVIHTLRQLSVTKVGVFLMSGVSLILFLEQTPDESCDCVNGSFVLSQQQLDEKNTSFPLSHCLTHT